MFKIKTLTTPAASLFSSTSSLEAMSQPTPPPPNPCLPCLAPRVPDGKENNKTYFANERTFIHWLNMAVTLGSISSALVAFGRKEDEAGIYTVSTEAQIMAGCLVTTGCAFAIYAMNIFYWRRGHIKEHTNVDDPIGPMILAGVLVVALFTILVEGILKMDLPN